MTTKDDDLAAIQAAIAAGPDAWGWEDEEGEIHDCISPATHATGWVGDYIVPLYALDPDQIRRLVERVERVERLEAACRAMLEWDAREKDHAVDFYARIDLCRDAFDKVRAALEGKE